MSEDKFKTIQYVDKEFYHLFKREGAAGFRRAKKLLGDPDIIVLNHMEWTEKGLEHRDVIPFTIKNVEEENE